MKQSFYLFLLGVIMAAFPACRKVAGEGPVVTEVRQVNAFTAVRSRISGDVRFVSDPVTKLEISAQRNILELIETSVHDGELVIRFKNNVNVRSHDDIDVFVSGPDVSSLALSGSGNLRTTGNYSPAFCRLSISGSGNISVDKLVAGKLEASISGSGNVDVLEGSVSEQTLKISGSGSMNLLNVVSKFATVSTSGSGTTRLSVSDLLDAQISGSGNVFYQGRPSVKASISGSGKVTPL